MGSARPSRTPSKSSRCWGRTPSTGKIKGFHGDIFVWKLHDAFRDLALFSSLACARAAGARDRYRALSSTSSFFVKRAGCPVDTPWHQDIPFWPVAGSQIASFWITLDPVTRASSGLEFVRGSHHWGSALQGGHPRPRSVHAGHGLARGPRLRRAPRRARRRRLGHGTRGRVAIWPGRVPRLRRQHLQRNRQARRSLSATAVPTSPTPRATRTMPLLWDHDLEPGDRLSGNLFPQVWPSVIGQEIERRMQGPEPPSEKQVGAFMQHLADSGFGPDGKKRTLSEAADKLGGPWLPGTRFSPPHPPHPNPCHQGNQPEPSEGAGCGDLAGVGGVERDPCRGGLRRSRRRRRRRCQGRENRCPGNPRRRPIDHRRRRPSRSCRRCHRRQYRCARSAS